MTMSKNSIRFRIALSQAIRAGGVTGGAPDDEPAADPAIQQPATQELGTDDDSLIQAAIAEAEAAAKPAEPDGEQLVKEEPAAADAKPEPETPAPGSKAADQQPEAKKEEVGDPQLNKSWEGLQAEKRQLWQERQALKSQQIEFEQAKAELGRLTESIKAMDTEGLKDPLGFMQQRFGLSLNDIADRVLQGGQPGAGEQVRRVSAEQEGKMSVIEKQLQEMRDLMQRQQEDALVNQYQAQVAALVEDPAHALLKAFPGGIQGLMARAVADAKAGAYLDPPQFVAAIETEYRNQLRALSAHEAVRKELGLTVAPPSKKNGDGSQSQKANGAGAPAESLTNKTAIEGASTVDDTPIWELDEDEQIRRAIAATGGA